MEQLSPSPLLSPEQRSAAREVVCGIIEGHIRSAEDPYASSLYADALGVYRSAEPESDLEYDLQRELAYHGIRTDDPELIAATLPLVRPSERHSIVASVAVVLHKFPERFADITNEHVSGWRDGVLSIGLYEIMDRYGSSEAVRNEINKITAQLSIDVLDTRDDQEAKLAYDYASGILDRVITGAVTGELLAVEAGDPSTEIEQYEDDLQLFGHVAATLGELKEAARYCGFESVALYEARNGRLDADRIERLIAEGSKIDRGYAELVAKLVIATQVRFHKAPDRMTQMTDNTVRDWLYDNVGTDRVSEYDLRRIIRKAGMALSAVNPGIYGQILGSIRTYDEVTISAELMSQMMSVNVDMPGLLDSQYRKTLNSNDTYGQFWIALFTSAYGIRTLLPEIPEFAELLERAGSIETTLRDNEAAGMSDNERQELAMGIADGLSAASSRYIGNAVLASLTVLEAMQGNKVLNFDNVRTVMKAMKLALTYMRRRSSQEQVVADVLNKADELRENYADGSEQPLGRLADLHLTGSYKGSKKVVVTGGLL